MTTPARYSRLRELFHQLFDLAAAEREERLRALGGADADLVDELRNLIAGADGDDDQLAAAAFAPEPVDDVAEPEPELAAGHCLGPWQVERLLGHGGMGSVYLGRRRDGAFEQQVAIKVIRAGLASRQLLRRFRAERQALANLSHPNIARLLDGGSSEDGQPYLVMEHVEGVSLEGYCEREALARPARVELFLAICAAVEHAHKNLVVHRDLKPSNILITMDGVPKLLDFGIAKLLDVPRGEDTRLLTSAFDTVGTLDFASPEQLRGEPVTTATDVYSLGVVLYRLLAGTHPYALAEVSLTEAMRRIFELEPALPSRAALAVAGRKARARARDLRGDLDMIVLTALRKEPARRYASAAALAEDLRRHRDGLPVAARQPSLRYRTGKFVRRHRVGLAAALLVACSLVGGLVSTRRQATVARLAAQQAELERAKAEAVGSFLAGMFSSANVGWRVQGGGTVSVADVLAGASERLDRELRDQPQVEARLRHVLGESEATLLEYGPATRDLERALALDLRLFGTQDLQTARAQAVLGWVCLNAGAVQRGTDLLDAAIGVYRSVLDPSPPDLVEALGWRSYGALVQDRLPQAAVLAREAVVRARARLDGHPLLPLAATLLGMVHASEGDVDGAERSYREALAAFSRLPDPDLPERRPALLYLGGLLADRGALDEAERLLREALAITEQRLGPDSALAVEPHYELGRLLIRRGDQGGAERELRAGLDIQRRRAGPEHPMLALGQVHLGKLLASQGRYAEAEGALRHALAAFAGFPGLSFRRAYAEVALADCLARQGRFAQSEELALAAYRRLSVTQSRGSGHTQEAVRALVELYGAWGKPEQRAEWAALIDPG